MQLPLFGDMNFRSNGMSEDCLYLNIWTPDPSDSARLPVLVYFLAVSGMVTARQLFAGTPYAVLAVFVTAAMLTPPDWVSQIFLGLPMVALYLLGVGVAWVFGGKRARGTASED